MNLLSYTRSYTTRATISFIFIFSLILKAHKSLDFFTFLIPHIPPTWGVFPDHLRIPLPLFIIYWTRSGCPAGQENSSMLK